MDKTGGLDGVRDAGLLESSVMSCMQTFDDQELYPDIIDKAAWITFSICKNHPFIDGNKRTAVLCMLTILRINKIEISYTQKELISLGLRVAEGSMGYEQIIEWIRRHKI
ncbi:type II toxin-antitoxin system death-on-curing family toxin [Monoglobus pectinilyticus]|uniref:type II toxin-antitoxin system death-on-curing family toxin n=1 Tax=Monoglobus pectinilyticus TaxID=1981510 RepID=UPI00399AF540